MFFVANPGILQGGRDFAEKMFWLGFSFIGKGSEKNDSSEAKKRYSGGQKRRKKVKGRYESFNIRMSFK